MLNVEDVPIRHLPKEKGNHHHPGPLETGLDKMTATLEEVIDAVQRN